MTDQLKFRCSGCQKVLNIPAKFRGKKIKCPNCSTVFQAGKKPATTEPASLAAGPSAGPDISLPQIIPAEEATPDLLDPAFENPTSPAETPSLQPDSFGDLDSHAAPVANVARSQQKVSRREALQRGQQKARQSDGDMDETDQKVQSAGLFLISLPVVASVLPLMGLQLRRLARAGEFAPLLAIFLGLIGAGCIAYARRKRSDGIPLAGAAAAFVLVSGVTGFMVLRTMSPGGSDGAQANRSTRPGRPSAAKTSPPPSAEEKAARAEASRKKMAENAERAARREAEIAERMRKTKERQQKSREERERQAAENKEKFDRAMSAGASRSGATENPFGVGQILDNTSTPEGSNVTPGTDSLPGNPFGSGASRSPFNDDAESEREPERSKEFIESLPHDFENAQARTAVHRRWGSGVMAFAKARQNPKLGKGLKFAPSIGVEQTTGKLFYYDQPIRGVEVMKIGAPSFVPIVADETPSDGAIAVGANQRLVGFNLAFGDGGIVGIQGLFVASDTDEPSDPVPGIWLGMETDDVQQAIVKKGASVHGFVCFQKGLDITGFALVYKN
jgi:phage FluMu protein Com